LQKAKPTPQIQEWYDKLAPVVREAREKLRQVEPGKLALRSGCERDADGNFRLTFLWREYVVSGTDFTVRWADSGAAALLEGLMDSDSSNIVRSSAAYCLGLIGDRKAIDVLIKAADDSGLPAEVRSYAVTGLGLLADESPTPAVSMITRNNNYTIMDTFLYELFNIN